jgi:hypothetical protein
MPPEASSQRESKLEEHNSGGTGQSVFLMEGTRGACLAIPARLPVARLLRAGRSSSSSADERALGRRSQRSVEGMMCGHLGDRAPAKRERDEMSFLSLPTSTSAGRPESRICLVKRKYLW